MVAGVVFCAFAAAVLAIDYYFCDKEEMPLITDMNMMQQPAP